VTCYAIKESNEIVTVTFFFVLLKYFFGPLGSVWGGCEFLGFKCNSQNKKCLAKMELKCFLNHFQNIFTLSFKTKKKGFLNLVFNLKTHISHI